jgi:flagellar protein FliL
MADDKSGNSPSGMGVKKILTIALIVGNFLIVGGGAYLTYLGTLGQERPSLSNAELDAEIVALRKELQTTPVTYSMETFNTNLEGLPRRFIRMEMSVEMFDQEGFEELVTMGGQARDAIMRIVTAKTLDEVDHVQGKLHLKNEITRTLNELMTRGVVKNVYFTKFQVQ